MGSPNRSNDSGSLLTRDPLPLAISLATAVTLDVNDDEDSSILLLSVLEAKKAGALQRLAVTRAVATAFWTCCCNGDVAWRDDVDVDADDDTSTDLCCCGTKAVVIAALLKATRMAAFDKTVRMMAVMGGLDTLLEMQGCTFLGTGGSYSVQERRE